MNCIVDLNGSTVIEVVLAFKKKQYMNNHYTSDRYEC